MFLIDLFERQTSDVQNTTKYRRLFHLTDNLGLALSIQNDSIKALRQGYISTTYRRETTSILGRHHYHYKFILNGKKLAQDYGVFDYDHHVTEIGLNSREEVSADEAEIGVNTKIISPLSEYLVGMVILSKPYTENQVLFLADMHRDSNGYSVEKIIHSISAINKLSVPIYWQSGSEFISLTEKDHQYLKDIEKLMKLVEKKNRTQRHLDLVEMLLDKYDIKGDDLIRGRESLDKEIIGRRRLIPQIMRELNSYYDGRDVSDIDSVDLKSMLVRFLDLMRFGNNTKAVIIHTAEKFNFFHPSIPPVAWTSMLRDLINGQIDAALEDIKEEEPSSFQMSRKSGYYHTLTNMYGSD